MDDKIISFWHEIIPFLLKEGEVYEISSIEKIDYLLNDFGNLSWEIGPDEYSLEEDKMYLAISPSLDRDLLALAKKFIGLAPPVENWNFYPYKQKKTSTKVKITNSNFSYVIDAKDFKFQVLSYDNYLSLDLDIFIENKSSVDVDNTIEIILTNLIGEYNFIFYIYEFRVLELDTYKGEIELWDIDKFLNYIENYARKNILE